MGDMLPYQPSLASATGTRVDTSCRHHQQCRVSHDVMLQLTRTTNDNDELIRNKYRYCIHKDEFVIGIGRPWDPSHAKKRINCAYPKVISNLGQMTGSTDEEKTYRMMWMYMFHNCTTIDRRNKILDLYKNHDSIAISDDGPFSNAFTTPEFIPKFLPYMFDPVSVGYAVTLGYAHPNSGDDMVTVQIGGLRTVMNGDFEVFTGDLLQWYFPFERDCFRRNGSRKPLGILVADQYGDIALYGPENNHHPYFDEAQTDDAQNTRDRRKPDDFPTRDSKRREDFYTRSFGAPRDQPKMVVKIKPYFPDTEHPRLYDGLRVFGTAISSARANEMVDIKISRQAV